jgi:NhaA family Na+:H+ antiporter
VYALLGFGIWCAMFASGVHATLAGVIVGLLTPTSSWVSRDRAAGVFLASGRALSESESPPRELFERVTLVSREALSPLARAEAALHAWVSFVIMPVFALANAGVRFELDQLTHPIALAVALGLLVGKCAGIALACLLAAVSKLAPLPQDVRWPQIVGAGALAGIGFTMALFIASLALEGRELDAAKVGILAGSAVSAVVGLAVLALNGRARDA